MIFVLSKLVDPLTQPGNLLVLLLALGAVLLAFGRRRFGGALVGFVALVSVAVMVLPVGDWVSAPLEDRFPRPELPSHIDGIVLLGGAVRVPMTAAHGVVALNFMAERITETLALAHRYSGVPVVVSGGNASIVPHGDMTEAAQTTRLLVADGVDPQRIVVEGRARNTYENAVYSKEVARPQPGQVWVLVTSANHMPRAVGCFHSVGFPVLPDPVDYHSGAGGFFGLGFAGNLDVLGGAVHEWIGLVAYRLLGRIDSFLPGPAPAAGAG